MKKYLDHSHSYAEYKEVDQGLLTESEKAMLSVSI